LDQNAQLGIELYQEKNYIEAIKYLGDAPLGDWLAQLYLGMSYYMVGNSASAEIIFMRVKTDCFEPDIRKKAEVAFAALKQGVNEREKRERAKLEHAKRSQLARANELGFEEIEDYKE
jgi:hypothetical protein